MTSLENVAELSEVPICVDGQQNETVTLSSDPAKCETEPNTHTEVDQVLLKICYGKHKYEIKFPVDETVEALKKQIENLTDVPAELQKVMFKGLMNDSSTLRQQKVPNGAKIMVIGSTVNEILSVTDSMPAKEKEKSTKVPAKATSKEPLFKQKSHKAVLDRFGRPDDLMPAVTGVKVPLPLVPISGMYNKHGHKVRLTFRHDLSEFWIGTKERTQKLAMGAVNAVIKGPTDDTSEYYILGLQLGTTEASCYWLYWVPSQYVASITQAVTGKPIDL